MGKCYYTPIDEGILEDPVIEDLMEEKGAETFGIYVGILTLFRRYEDENFSIPFRKIGKVAGKFGMSVPRFRKNLDYLLQKGLLHTFDASNGETYFYSVRRQKELVAWKEVNRKQSLSASKTNESRWGKK